MAISISDLSNMTQQHDDFVNTLLVLQNLCKQTIDKGTAFAANPNFTTVFPTSRAAWVAYATTLKNAIQQLQAAIPNEPTLNG